MRLFFSINFRNKTIDLMFPTFFAASTKKDHGEEVFIFP